MIKFAIIDDNKATVKTLSHTLENIFLKYNYDACICFETTKANNLLNYLNNNTINVLILDIDLQYNINGFEIAKKVRKNNKNCYFIFVSAHTEYSLEAFKLRTFDFLSKPLKKKDLENCINRLFDDINDFPKKFIKLDNKNTIIDENEIKFIERNGMKLVFHTKSRDYEIYSSFAKLKEFLPINFVRCHKSFVANLNNITKVEPLTNTIYFNEFSCDIGPKYKTSFLEVISHYKN